MNGEILHASENSRSRLMRKAAQKALLRIELLDENSGVRVAASTQNWRVRFKPEAEIQTYELGEFIAMHGCNFKIRRNEKRITHCQLRLIGLNGQVGAVAVGVKCVESEGERIEN